MTDTETADLLTTAGGADSAAAGAACQRLLREAEALADQRREAERTARARFLAAELLATAAAPPPRTNVPDLPSATEVPRHPAAVRRLLCRLLGIVAGRAEVSALATAMRDVEARDAARCALESVPGIPATKALVAALPQPGTAFRVGVVRALSARRDREALGSLSQLAAGEPDAEVRLAAVDGIARFPEQTSDRLLAKLSQEGDPRLRTRARAARLRLADTLRRHGVTAAADAILRDAAAARGDDGPNK